MQTSGMKSNFWLSRLREVEQFLNTVVRKGSYYRLTTSAGGRPVWAYEYGLRPREKALTNFSAAYRSQLFDTFYGPNNPEHPIVVVVCGTHGAEMEGVVGAVNLIHILETGTDLRGEKWPQIASFAKQMRLIIVPLHNPDGRERVEPESLTGLSFEEFRYWAQGKWRSGELIGYPDCKRFQPLPLDEVEFLGGYPNDTGYNIMHDAVMTGPKTPEALALLQLIEQERPDVVVHVHSCEFGPFVIGPSEISPESHRGVHELIVNRMHDMWLRRGLRPHRSVVKKVYSFNLATACFLSSGALSFTVEGPHGIARLPYTKDEILDVHLSFYQELFDVTLNHPIRARTLLGW